MGVTHVDIARWRLRSQHLADPGPASATDVVSSLLGVQAENPAQSAWAVATRTATPDPADLAAALDDGRVLRTHVLRPTWHYVTAEDLVWLVDVTASGAGRPILQQLRTGSRRRRPRPAPRVRADRARRDPPHPSATWPGCWSSPGGRSAATT